MTWAKMTKQRSNVYLALMQMGRCCQYVMYVPFLFGWRLIDELALKFNQLILCGKTIADDVNVRDTLGETKAHTGMCTAFE